MRGGQSGNAARAPSTHDLAVDFSPTGASSLRGRIFTLAGEHCAGRLMIPFFHDCRLLFGMKSNLTDLLCLAPRYYSPIVRIVRLFSQFSASLTEHTDMIRSFQISPYEDPIKE